MRNRLKGGRADGMTPDDFDADALARGTDHELEHTTHRGLAREIAMDHLAADPHYYANLEAMEASTESHKTAMRRDDEQTKLREALERDV